MHDLVYDYGDRRALDGLSLSIEAGSIYGLLGPNGSGKSTLLSILIGRRQAAAGETVVLGQDLSSSLRSRMGMVFQEPSLDANMTVAETMALQGRLFGMSGDAIDRESARLLSQVDLADRTGSMTATLSGGMKRRLELARALLSGPELILLDEPTLALDPDSRQRLWQHLLAANTEGRTLVLATNDVYEAERYCQRVALLDHGKVVSEGEPAELKRGLRQNAVRIEWRGGAVDGLTEVSRWDGVGSVQISGNVMHATVDDAATFLARIFQACGDQVHSVRIEESTLEDVYFQLVGRGISENGEHDEEATE